MALYGGAVKWSRTTPTSDTHAANVEASGAVARDFVIPAGLEAANEHPFKGNMDVDALKAFHGPRTMNMFHW